jgi:hypothetical protein
MMLDYEEIGREVVRLWQRAMTERKTEAQLGADVDKLLCWGPETVRAKTGARNEERSDVGVSAQPAEKSRCFRNDSG